MTSTRAISAGDAPEPVGGYAQAMEVADMKRLLFVSGQIPVRPDGTLPETFAEQARQAWTNLAAQLRAGGMSLDNLVKVTIFLSDRAYGPQNRAVRREVLGQREVALTVVIAEIFDAAWLLEIEAIAAA
jgi:2-iminobutanoate/2-iminopropanoate deaminase